MKKPYQRHSRSTSEWLKSKRRRNQAKGRCSSERARDRKDTGRKKGGENYGRIHGWTMGASDIGICSSFPSLVAPSAHRQRRCAEKCIFYNPQTPYTFLRYILPSSPSIVSTFARHALLLIPAYTIFLLLMWRKILAWPGGERLVSHVNECLPVSSREFINYTNGKWKNYRRHQNEECFFNQCLIILYLKRNLLL